MKNHGSNVFLTCTLTLLLIALTGCSNISRIYEDALDFHDGFAAVKQNNLYGIIDTKGNIAVEPGYEKITLVDSTTALAMKSNLWQLIDMNNHQVSKIRYDAIGETSDDIIVASLDKKYGCINTNGDILLDFSYDEIKLVKNNTSIYAITTLDNKAGIAEVGGTLLIPPVYDQIYTSNLKENIITIKNNSKFGFINLSNNKITEPMYENFLFFNDGIAAIHYNEKYGYINNLNEVIIEPAFETYSNFSQGLAYFKADEKYGYLNPSGEIVIQAQYDTASTFKDGLAYVTKGNNALILNTKGEILYEVPTDDVHLESYPNFFTLSYTVMNSTKSLAIDKSGKVLFETNYDTIGIFNNGLAKVYKDLKTGFINEKGIEVIPPIYDDIFNVNNNFFIIVLNRKHGLINNLNEDVLPPVYDDIKEASPEILYLTLKEKHGIYNIPDEKLIEPIYEHMGTLQEGLIPVALNNQWFYIDSKGYELR